jgi:hypothetical protein
VDADVSTTSDMDADGEVVWSWRPDAGAKVATMREAHRAGDGDNKAWSHRGERGVSRKPLRGECRAVLAEPVGQRALFAQFSAR